MKTADGLTFGNYRLCSACSRGLHADHSPVLCDCDICTEEQK